MAQILIVDDEMGIRELLSEILTDEGHTISLAENATRARQHRTEKRPDLVLLDIWMPDTDGISLLKEWSSTGLLTMPVVMMSGHGTIDSALEATRVGAVDFLEKPIALQKLLSTVDRALKHGEMQMAAGLSFEAMGASLRRPRGAFAGLGVEASGAVGGADQGAAHDPGEADGLGVGGEVVELGGFDPAHDGVVAG